MQYFAHCPQCELLILGVIVIAFFIGDYINCKRRKWGSNYPKIWGKR